MLKLFFYLMLFFTFLAAQEHEEPVVLNTIAHQSYPKYYLDENGNMQGLCIDIINEIEQTVSGVRFQGQNEFLPFKRMLKMLELGKIDVMFGIKLNDKRKKLYRYIDHPLYNLNYRVAVRQSDDITIQALDDIKKLGRQGVVITPLGAGAEQVLDQEGGLTIMTSKDITDAFNLLQGEWGRFVFYHDLGLYGMIHRQGIHKQFKLLPASFQHYSHYAAFSKNVPNEIISKIENALDTMEKNGKLAHIRKPYFR